MTVRYLAEELYRWTREVEDLEKTLAALEVGSSLGGAGPAGDGAPPAPNSNRPISGPFWSPKRPGPGYNFCRDPRYSLRPDI